MSHIYSLHWLTISSRNLEKIKLSLEKSLSKQINLVPYGESFYRINGIEEIVIKKHRDTIYHLEFPGSLFDRNIGWNLAAQTFFSLIELEDKPKIARVDIKTDIIGQTVVQVWPREYMSNQPFIHSASWEPQYFGDPPSSFRLLHKRHEAKIRIYDKIRQIQFLISESKATNEHIELLRNHRHTHVTRVEFEIKGRFAKYATELFRQPDICETDFANNVVSKFLANNRAVINRDDTGQQQITCDFWRSLDPLDKNFIRLKIPTHESQTHRDETAHTAAIIRNRMKKWGYSDSEALLFLMKTLNLQSYSGIWDHLPDYASLLSLYKTAERKSFTTILRPLDGGAVAEPEADTEGW